jgi:hypothetical protein
MDDGTPTLEVGFTIDPGESFTSLRTLDDMLGKTAADAVRECMKIEAATKGAVNMGPATAQLVAFGNATTKAGQDSVRASNQAEKAAEGMVRQIQRQTEVFGKSASEIRNMRAETRALAAEGSGLTELASRLRTANAEMNRLEIGTGSIGKTSQLAGHHTRNLAFQFQDLGVQLAGAAGSSAPFKLAMMAMLQQGAQIQGIMMQAGIGIRGVAVAFGQMSKAILLATLTNPYLLAFAAAVTVIAGSIKLMQSAANDDKPMKAYAASLGLTAKEIRNLDNVTVTFGDTAKAVFQVAGAAIWSGIGPAVTGVWKTMKEWLDWIGTGVKSAVNFMIGGFVGAYAAITKTWQMFPAVMGDAFFSAVNASIGAINSLVQKSVAALNMLASQANKILPEGLKIPELKAGEIASVENRFAGNMAEVGKAGRAAVEKAMKVDYVGAVAGAIETQAQKNARARIKKDATDKGYLDPEKGKTDKHAEQLARDAEAVEAQIRNLYKLADAYGVSGAAALIAEARVKAESQAIKQRGDIEEAVARQVALAIAQRVADAAKSTAAMREQAAAQDLTNASIAAGNIPAEQAAEFIRNRMADLPLLGAIEAAHAVNRTQEADAATKALAAQRDARDKLTDSEREGQRLASISSGNDKLAELRAELSLIGATDAARVHALATLKATQEATARGWAGPKGLEQIDQQVKIADMQELLRQKQQNYNHELSFTADKWDAIAQSMQAAGQGMADAFGSAGAAIGDMASIFSGFEANRERAELQHRADIKAAGKDQAAVDKVNRLFALRSSGAQVEAYGDMAGAAKNFFKAHSVGYKVMEGAEKAFRAVQMAMAIKSMLEQIGLIGVHVATKVVGDTTMAVSDTARATVEQGNSFATTAVKAVEAVVNAIASLPFPANLVAGAATAAAIVALGVGITGGFGGGGNTLPKANTGTGTVLGDSGAKSESIKNAIDALKEVDTLTNVYSRQMAASLKSIDNQIGGVAALVVRSGNINASSGVAEGFKMNAIGSVLSKIPLIGGILGGLFGSKTSVIGSGLYGGAQTVGSIVNNGFDASYYSDVEKKKKFLGITTGTSYSTKYTGADAGLENQFTLILKEFNTAIAAAAGPLGVATGDVQARLNSFVVNIGKIDLQGLTGTEIQEKLSAVFGAAADGMAAAAIPGMEQFQKVGEGLFETLVRVASTVEAVGTSLDLLGTRSQGMSVAVKLGLADQFDSVSALTDAAGAYFTTYYSQAEQAAAQTAQMGKVFGSLGLSMPATLTGFRQLVEAQDLTTTAGQATYATLLKLAPAFADLQTSMEGAKSAADIASERQDLQRQLLELQGTKAAIRALDLAKLDDSNRALQQQVWAVQDAQDAAAAAKQLADAWKSVGDTILAEINRIRGISDASGGNSFASLTSQFNAATIKARAGDQDAAKLLPGLSQSLLTAAANAATSRQELDRIQAQTAASLEATYGVMSALMPSVPRNTTSTLSEAAQAAQAASAPAAANDDTASELRALREEMAAMRADNNAGHAANASVNTKTSRILESVTAASGGDAISVANAA